MNDVTAEAKKRPVALFSKTTATLFPGRPRSYWTGVTAADVEDLEVLASDAVSAFAHVKCLETCPKTGEVLVVLVNDRVTPVLVTNAMELCTVRANGPAPTSEKPALTEEALSEVIGADHETILPESVEILVKPGSDAEEALEEALDLVDEAPGESE